MLPTAVAGRVRWRPDNSQRAGSFPIPARPRFQRPSGRATSKSGHACLRTVQKLEIDEAFQRQFTEIGTEIQSEKAVTAKILPVQLRVVSVPTNQKIFET
jgi:hypothetical protein